MGYLSPLRYPGGKGLLLNFVSDVVSRTMGGSWTYVEPFAGGAGIALGLLENGVADSAVIGDIDPAVAAFWRAVFDYNDEFIELVRRSDVTIESWHENAHVLKNCSDDVLRLGFAAFFLNRTNRSGILRARPIGGLEQSGSWRLDCRFNRAELVNRIRRVGQYSDRIQVYNGGAFGLLSRLMERDVRSTFVYCDPPYLTKSSGLYLDSMDFSAHLQIAEMMRSRFPHWMVSYDRDDRVGSILYPDVRLLEFKIRHSASRSHLGSEIAALSDSCVVDADVRLPKESKWRRACQHGELRQLCCEGSRRIFGPATAGCG